METKALILRLEQEVQGMETFVLYRMPHEKTIHLMGGPRSCMQSYASYDDIEEDEGFVFAPFSLGSTHPILVFSPENKGGQSVSYTLDPSSDSKLKSSPVSKQTHTTSLLEEDEAMYQSSFQCFERALHSGQFQKLVLARRASYRKTTMDSTPALFLRLCLAYPEAMASLVCIPEGNARSKEYWLGASPEILLNYANDEIHTVALAGTTWMNKGHMLDLAQWSPKNRQEQAYVSEYLRARLEQRVPQVEQSLPYVVQAGQLLHIKTDFRAKYVIRGKQLFDLAQHLHPTPAICGLPKEKALSFILEHEPFDRRYYAGFLGPFSLSSAHFFVNLRCTQFSPLQKDGTESQIINLYAGGGLLPDSTYASEWNETGQKMKTLLRLL